MAVRSHANAKATLKQRNDYMRTGIGLSRTGRALDEEVAVVEMGNTLDGLIDQVLGIVFSDRGTRAHVCDPRKLLHE